MDAETEHRSHTPNLAVGVLLVAVAALLGWMLLELAKGVVVLSSYAIGAALIAVPLLLHRLILGEREGRERWQRRGVIATAVLIGVALIVIAHFVSRHGWLLIAIPAGLMLLARGAEHLAHWWSRHQRPEPVHQSG